MSEIIWVLNRFNKSEKIPIIENPTQNEYELFLSNTKYQAIRGICVDGNVYVADAQIETHDNMYNDLKQLKKINGNIEVSFDECLNGSLIIRGTITDKIKSLLGEKIESKRRIELDYFDIERLFDEVCIAGYESVADGLNIKYKHYNIDFKDFLPGHKSNKRTLEDLNCILNEIINRKNGFTN